MNELQKSEWHEADIVGFSERGPVGCLINLLTFGVPFWGIGHVGTIARHVDELLLYHSTAAQSLPCAITGKFVDGVQAQRPDEFIAQYPGRIWRYPSKRVPPSEALTWWLEDKLGTAYDYVGAMEARKTPLAWLHRKLTPESLNRIFCSEYLAAMLRYLGWMDFKDASEVTPNALCRSVVRAGVYGKPERVK